MSVKDKLNELAQLLQERRDSDVAAAEEAKERRRAVRLEIEDVASCFADQPDQVGLFLGELWDAGRLDNDDIEWAEGVLYSIGGRDHVYRALSRLGMDLGPPFLHSEAGSLGSGPT